MQARPVPRLPGGVKNEVPFTGRSTYAAEFPVHDLPERRTPAAAQTGRQAGPPMESMTTSRMDYQVTREVQ